MTLSKTRLRQASFLIGISILLLTLARLLLPVGDEPDFEFSTSHVLFGEHGVFSPFYYFQPLLLRHTPVVVQPTGWSTTYRLALTLTIALPLYLYLIKASAARHKRAFSARPVRQDYIALSLLLPSMWFHLGILGGESLILMILLLTFCTDSRALKLALFTVAVSVDLGDSIVFAYYWVLYRSFLLIVRHQGVKSAWILLLGVAVVSYVFSMNLLTLLTWIPVVGDRAAFIFDAYTNVYTDVNSKYPLFLRPAITLMGLIFMLPQSHMMVVPAYPIALGFVGLMIVRVSRLYQKYPEAVASIYAGMAMIISIPMILPGFSNAKYYVFILPVILRGFLIAFKRDNVMLWILILNLTVFARLLWNYFYAKGLSY